MQATAADTRQHKQLLKERRFELRVLTIAKRLVNPETSDGVLVNFWLKASLRLWAGSVEMIRTFFLTAAN